MKTTTSTKITRTAITVIIGLVLLGATATTYAYDHSIYCWRASTWDTDNDGFADYDAPLGSRVEFPGGTYANAVAMTCPVGWVMARGDSDDSDANVYPRSPEVGFNNIDDNCDGRIDEPSFYYSYRGYSNTTSAFTMKMVIKDNLPIAYYNSAYWDLIARVEYQELKDTSVTHTSNRLVSSLWSYASYSRTDVRLYNLQAGTVYRARVQFRARYKTNHAHQFNVGERTTWYYTMTDSTIAKVKARKRIVLRALSEAYLSDRLYTGYLGNYPDGTRYDGDQGEWWCSEFYSWVADHELVDMGSLSNTTKLREYFEDRGGWAEIPDPPYSYLVGFANAGDYLGIGADEDNLGHSAMFLEYEPARDMVWSVEGNVSGLSDIGGPNASRAGGNEARVVQRRSSTVGGWGMIKSSMIDD